MAVIIKKVYQEYTGKELTNETVNKNVENINYLNNYVNGILENSYVKKDDLDNIKLILNNLQTQITHLQNTNLWDILVNNKFKTYKFTIGSLVKPVDKDGVELDFTRDFLFKIGDGENISASLFNYKPNFEIQSLDVGKGYDFMRGLNDRNSLITSDGIFIKKLAYTNIDTTDSLAHVNFYGVENGISLILYYWQPTETEYKTQQILQGKEYLEPHIRLQKIKEQEKEKQKELNNGN